MAHSSNDQAITIRPPRTTVQDAQRALAARSVEMRAFVTACLSAVAEDPEAFLRHLDGHWPPAKPRGRPPVEQTHHLDGDPRNNDPGNLEVHDQPEA